MAEFRAKEGGMDSKYDPAEEALCRPPRPGEFLALVAFLIIPFVIGVVVQSIAGAGKVLRRLAHA